MASVAEVNRYDARPEISVSPGVDILSGGLRKHGTHSTGRYSFHHINAKRVHRPGNNGWSWKSVMNNRVSPGLAPRTEDLAAPRFAHRWRDQNCSSGSRSEC